MEHMGPSGKTSNGAPNSKTNAADQFLHARRYWSGYERKRTPFFTGFLTDDLTVNTHMTGGMAKYLGVCRLPETDAKHRRIDIIVTPYSQVSLPWSSTR